MNEFDLGWRSCLEDKVSPLYIEVEKAIDVLQDEISEFERLRLIQELKKALKEANL